MTTDLFGTFSLIALVTLLLLLLLVLLAVLIYSMASYQRRPLVNKRFENVQKK